MSTNENVLRTGNQSITNYDTSKMFLWNNRYIKANYTNSTYDPIDLLAGTVMGRVTATGEVIPLESDASDGSQIPLGILANDVTVEDGDTVELNLCVGGDVASEKIVLAKTGDTLATMISGRSIADRIAGDTLGIKLVAGTQMSAFDNQ